MSMNRREFIRSLIIGHAGSCLLTDVDLDAIVSRFASLEDTEFEYRIKFMAEMWVSNPRQSVIITSLKDE